LFCLMSINEIEPLVDLVKSLIISSFLFLISGVRVD
jgi:hypothetical protein